MAKSVIVEKKCTREFTEIELKKIRDIFKWLKSMI